MLEGCAADLDPVDESAVVTLEVGDFVGAAGDFADVAVSPGDRRFTHRHLVRRISSQGNPSAVHGPNRSLQGTGNSHQPRVRQVCLRMNSLAEIAG